MKKDEKMYIIRTLNTGVFYGKIKELKDTTITLTDCRRLWYWSGAASLSQLANEGVKYPDKCKFTVVVKEITIFGVLEIIPVSSKAISNINSVPIWKI